MIKKKVSIVVPTYREAENVPVLAEKIDDVLRKAGYKYEIIIVDDNSQDGIEEAVAKIAGKYSINLKVRKDERGLSSAVIAGFDLASAEVILVMDADLSHPVDVIPVMLDKIFNEDKAFVIGSRNVPGGSAENFNLYRMLNAWISRTLARPFAKVTDPMSGFFAFKASLLTPEVRHKLNPIGWKICLEMLVKASPAALAEIPIKFGDRLYGKSKLSFKEQINYFLHLWSLFQYKYKTLSEFVKFSMVGASGAIVDLTIVFISFNALLASGILNRIHSFQTAQIIAFVFAVTTNFFLNRMFTFTHAKHDDIVHQYFAFVTTCTLGFVINWSISSALFTYILFFNTHYLLSKLIGILSGIFVNFTGSKFIAFRKRH